MKPYRLTAVVLATLAAFAQPHRAELFDTTGMPRRSTNFIEQQISEMIATHKAGDLADAARIQRKLGSYYADKGDEKRSTGAFLAAAEAEKRAEPRPEDSPKPIAVGRATAPAQAPSRRGEPAQPLPVPSFTGNYYGYEGRTLHTWDFYENGTFLHTWIASGTGTSVRNSERGSYRVLGDALELKLTSAASGFVTPGVGDRTTIAGGGAGESADVRQAKLVRSGDGILLDGMKLKPKSW